MKTLKVMAIALLACAGLAACSGGSKEEANNDNAKEQTEAAAPASEARIDTMDKVADTQVYMLSDDNAVRPGRKYDKPLALDFNATWCVPCKRFAPVFDEAAVQFEDVDFVSVDIDVMPATAQAFNVTSVPTVILLDKDGKMVGRYEGLGELLPQAPDSSSFLEKLKTL
ncbi:MAG: thioredoxin family protein [Muribaculaceae bacterium]|nr:thioredoxin family protein [Muribaculaceae bacterium]